MFNLAEIEDILKVGHVEYKIILANDVYFYAVFYLDCLGLVSNIEYIYRRYLSYYAPEAAEFIQNLEWTITEEWRLPFIRLKLKTGDPALR